MKLGSRFKRFIAYLIDIIILCIPIFVVMLFSGSLSKVESPSLYDIFVHLIAAMYFILFEQSRYQATPGKMLMKLYVADMDGKRLSAWRAIVRYIWLWVPLLPSILIVTIASLYPETFDITKPSFPVAMAYILGAISSLILSLIWQVPILFKSRRGMYEKLSNTVVLSR